MADTGMKALHWTSKKPTEAGTYLIRPFEDLAAEA